MLSRDRSATGDLEENPPLTSSSRDTAFHNFVRFRSALHTFLQLLRAVQGPGQASYDPVFLIRDDLFISEHNPAQPGTTRGGNGAASRVSTTKIASPLTSPPSLLTTLSPSPPPAKTENPLPNNVSRVDTMNTER